MFPAPDMPLTHILVVRNLADSIAWYRDVLGATFDREYGGSSAVFSFNDSWLLLVMGGQPTADKPGIEFAAPSDQSTVGHAFTIRVSDCAAAYDVLLERGAEFITPPYDWGTEIRCFFRDPDGVLFEISQYVGSE